MDKRTFKALYGCVRRWWVNQSPVLRESVDTLYPGRFDKFVAMYESVAWIAEYKLAEESSFNMHFDGADVYPTPETGTDAQYWGDSLSTKARFYE